MQRRKFLSSVLGGMAGRLSLAARGDTPEQSHREPEAAARSPQTPEYWAPLLTLTLADGREVRAHQFAARRTYLSMISGWPDDSANESILKEIKEFCRRTFVVEDSIIIPPVMIPRHSDDENWTECIPPEFQCENWCEYPPVFAAALFQSISGARRDGMFSELAVGWFQSRLSPLVPDDILAAIRKLDWTNLAHDVWW